MPNRLLKERICTSPDLNQLTWQEEVFFYRLLVQCDDFGRYEAHPAVVRSRCFPLRLAKVSERTVAKMLNRLAEVHLILLYQVEGRGFLQVINWSKHQQTRATASKFPQPLADASNGYQPLADVPVLVLGTRTRNSYSNGADSPMANGRERPRDLIFEAVVEACGYGLEDLTRDQRGRVNSAAKQLRDVGATPDEIRDFGIFWPLHYPDADLTPQAITGNWAEFKNGNLLSVRQERRRR